MRLRTSLPAVVVFVLACARLSAQSPPLSPEFQVNTSTTNYQAQSSVSMDDAGNFVVVWESYQTGDSDVFAQRFDTKGTPIGGEFRVNTYTTNYQGHPSVAANLDGSFVVAWSSYNQNEVKGTNIYAQRYDTSGSPAGGEFRVNTYTTGYQYGPSVASDANGNFVVVWSSYLQDGDLGGVYGQVFDNTGSPVNGEFRANQFTTGYQWRPSVAYGGNGDFVVAWESQGQDGDGYAVMARRYAPDGTPRADEFQVNQQTTGDQSAPAVAADSGGDFVVTWHSAGQDGSEFGIMARRFGSSGVAAGAEFQVNTYTTDYQTYPRIGMDAKGNFLIAWRSFGQDGDAAGTDAQRFDASTARVGSEFQVNTTTTGYQDQAALALGRGGRFVITWSSPDSGSDSEIWARMASPLPAPMQVDPVPPSRPASPQGVAQNGILEPGESVTVSPSWTNNTPNALALTGTASNFTGPAGAVYTLTDASANYGSIA